MSSATFPNLPLLPIGQQDYPTFRKRNLVYVDKTDYILSLINHGGQFFFLSRPRRFGKSLLVSTLKTIFQGKKELFEGLYIYDKWDFEPNPIIHLDFSKMGFRDIGLTTAIEQTLRKIAQEASIELTSTGNGLLFAELLQKLHAQSGKEVVVLIDEYDKPITDVLEFGKSEKAHEHLGILRTLYSVLKGNSEHIRFFFMTGIARFSKVSLFSDLNNLRDISRDNDFHNLLGYTQNELTHYFEPYLSFIAQEKEISIENLLEQIKVWYNGFSWNGKDKVYNPFSLLNFFASREFENFWFETGTPRFLIEKMKEIQVYDVANTKIDALSAENLSIDDVQLIPLLFQTGYLTLKKKDQLGGYLLDYPNKEVYESMLKHILMGYTHSQLSPTHATNIIRAIFVNDLDQLIREINILFATIPYQIFDINQEKYFHAILFLSLKICGFYIESEVSVSTGRIDAVMIYENKVYIFEFKLNESADSSLQQIREKQYFKKYDNQDKKIILVGIGFSGKTKEVSDWKVETV